VQEEGGALRLAIEVNAVIVPGEVVSVPVAEDGFHREEGDEAVDIQDLLEPWPALRGIRFLACGEEFLDVGAIHRIAFVFLQIWPDLVAGAAVVEAPSRAGKKVSEEVLGESFLEYVERGFAVLP
jgi:hypothetical protein